MKQCGNYGFYFHNLNNTIYKQVLPTKEKWNVNINFIMDLEIFIKIFLFFCFQ